jgi:hypothetical protein
LRAVNLLDRHVESLSVEATRSSCQGKTSGDSRGQACAWNEVA